MNVERAELPGEEAERDWRDRLGEILSIGRGLFATRLAIFREEATGKVVLAAKGLVAVAVALTLTVGALLLAAALLVALLAKLTNSLILGTLLAVALYAAGAAAAGWMAFKSLSTVRPFEFPSVAAELERDWKAIDAALAPLPGTEGVDGEPCDSWPAGDEADVADLEERLRRGTE